MGWAPGVLTSADLGPDSDSCSAHSAARDLSLCCSFNSETLPKLMCSSQTPDGERLLGVPVEDTRPEVYKNFHFRPRTMVENGASWGRVCGPLQHTPGLREAAGILPLPGQLIIQAQEMI
ncbi:hypothetical protein RRG08_055594 [Elysia crispata]|uniref:Uncharacterized protein n=1 Tax=Elysia crispata TaxID=231223 RepID=A0AAE1B1Z7_9GAST|nr:hypothetical protein RRG08_055594 [Elysia crispata]